MTHVEGIGHVGFTVDNLHQAQQSFIQAFGFTAGAEVALDEGFSESVTGIREAKIKVGFVHGPHGLTIELLEYAAPESKSKVSHRTCDTGSAHLALYVDNLEAALTSAEEAGWSLLGKVTKILVGPRAGGFAAYATEPNGIVIELVEKPSS